MASTKPLALLGGKALGTIPGPQFPYFTPRAISRVGQLLKKGRTVGLGHKHPEIRECEEAIARYHDGRKVLGTSSGHSALHMALAGLEIGEGDEVITTPYTWGASISCILHQNAIPVFGDVDPMTGLLDPNSITPLITPRTKAILAVHIYGQPADMTRITAIARKHGLKVIEDGSQAHGATHKGQVVGNFGDAAGFSCMGGKLLASSEAGYMVTPHKEAYWRACLQSQHPTRLKEDDKSTHLHEWCDSLVYTYRLNPITAVLLTEQLKKLDKEIGNRRKNVAQLRKNLRDSKYVVFPNYGKDAQPSYHILTMNYEAHGDAVGVSRDTFIKALGAEGMPIMNYVPAPIPQWKRLQTQTYRGPLTTWTSVLKRAGVDYSRVRTPNAQYKVDHALEMGFNYYKPAANIMQRFADIVYKVEANIDALREWEKGQKKQEKRKSA